ncbi:MAG TPA: DUF4012 domain-containing protein [Patescibacteria group bacterium]|jgi:hypothetical protein|nr:DUF4012 domain-containing protein [Patescibacteria group bacterium]
MKKQIKLYLHHAQYEPVTYDKRTGVFGFIKKFISSLLKLFIGICYGVGIGIVSLVMLPWQVLLFVASIPKKVPGVLKKIKTQQFQKTVAVFALLAVLAASSIHGLNLIAAGQNVKGQVLGESGSALNYLKDAQVALESQNTAAAQISLSKALEQFKNSKETLNSTSIVLKGLLAVVPQKQDADRLLAAAQDITEAGIKGTQLLELTGKMKISAVGLSGDVDNKAILLQIQTLLNDSVELGSSASEAIGEVSISSLPQKYQASFLAAKDAASLFQQNVSTLKEVCSLVFDLLLGSKNILLVFQNNNELRASGGFMGTIGNAKLTDGSIASLQVKSVYDWDGQLQEKILPPQPMYSVNNQWYLRDSNWFASFPQSASRIGALYEKEGGETPDLIVTMTPDIILEMLNRTGPIELPQYGMTLTKDNFVEKTQEATSITYDKTLNQPKQFLADFFPLLMEKLGNSQSGGGVMTFLEIFQQGLYKKDVLLCSRNADIEKKILAFNWGGELRDTDRDYLSIVNSNLGGTKTDRSLERTTQLVSNIEADGKITDTLTYTIKNPLPNMPGLGNKTFMRVYVPKGSKLISSDGFNSQIQLPKLDTGGYVYDDQVQEWQKDLSQDITTGTYSGTEAGKSWFGNWIETAGGETKTVTIKYELPFKLNNIDRHSLLVQKQPGSMTGSFNYELNFPGRTSMWNSNNTQLENAKLKYSQDLLADSFIGIVLRK